MPCEELKQGLGLCCRSEVDPACPQSCPPPALAQAQHSQGGRSCAGSVGPSVIRYILESSQQSRVILLADPLGRGFSSILQEDASLLCGCFSSSNHAVDFL